MKTNFVPFVHHAENKLERFEMIENNLFNRLVKRYLKSKLNANKKKIAVIKQTEIVFLSNDQYNFIR